MLNRCRYRKHWILVNYKVMKTIKGNIIILIKASFVLLQRKMYFVKKLFPFYSFFFLVWLV
jgi:hypothetical protein